MYVSGIALPVQRPSLLGRHVHRNHAVHSTLGHSPGKSLQAIGVNGIVVGHQDKGRIGNPVPDLCHQVQAVVRRNSSLQSEKAGLLDDWAVRQGVAERNGYLNGIGARFGQRGDQFHGGFQVGKPGGQVRDQARPVFCPDGVEFFFSTVPGHSCRPEADLLGLAELSTVAKVRCRRRWNSSPSATGCLAPVDYGYQGHRVLSGMGNYGRPQ